jgi:uncharacterized integral membrane protein
MILPLILGIALGAASVVFALQNAANITVTFFTWQFEGSLSLILLLSVAMGILISLLIVLPESISKYFQYRSLKKENAKLAEELRKQKELTVFAKQTPATPEALAKLDQGVIAHPNTV